VTFPTALAWIARILVGGLFLLAGAMKIGDPLHFAQEIQAYRMVPDEVTNVMAFLLPWLEVFAGALLVIGIWRGEARLVIFGMLVVFTAAKVWAEIKGLRISCGCFGSLLGPLEKSLSGVNGIVLNVFLMGLLVADFICSRRPSTPRISVERGADSSRATETSQSRSA
jgi:uncharacterized membrane protein YphA (DoxX/SURF4 family)